MQIKLAPGTEQYVKYAKNRLQRLEEFRTDMNVPVLQRHFEVAPGVMAHIKTSEWEQYIRIEGSGKGGFLVIPFIILPDTTVLTGSRSLIPRTLTTIESYTFNPSFVVPYPFKSGQSYLTAAIIAGSYGYLSDREFSSGTGVVAGYTAVTGYNGVTYRVGPTGVVYPMSSLTPISGAFAQSYQWAGFYGINGQAISYFYDSVGGPWILQKMTFSTDDDMVVNITYDTPEITNSFGDERTVASFERQVSGDFGIITSSNVITHDIEFAVCKSLDADGTIKQITSHSIKSYSQSSNHEEFNDETTAFTFSDNNSTINSLNVEFTLPSGETHQIEIIRESQLLSASGSGDPGVGIDSGSISYSYSSLVKEYIPQFASVSWNTLIYRLNEVESTQTQTGSHTAAFSIFADVISNSTSRIKFNMFIDGTLIELASDELISDSTFGAAGAGLTGISPPDTSTGSDITTPYSGNPYFNAERLPVGDTQFGRLITREYLGYLTFNKISGPTEHIVFASKENLDALKRATINHVLREYSRPVLEVDADISEYNWGFTEIRVV